MGHLARNSKPKPHQMAALQQQPNCPIFCLADPLSNGQLIRERDHLQRHFGTG